MAKITVFGQPAPQAPPACACPDSSTGGSAAGGSPMETALKIAAGGVQSMTHGSRSMTQVDTSKLIELDKYQRQVAAGSNPLAGIQILQLQGGSPRE